VDEGFWEAVGKFLGKEVGEAGRATSACKVGSVFAGMFFSTLSQEVNDARNRSNQGNKNGRITLGGEKEFKSAVMELEAD
jgi:hypothetical protein